MNYSQSRRRCRRRCGGVGRGGTLFVVSRILVLSLVLLVSCFASAQEEEMKNEESTPPVSYGVDVSWPMTSLKQLVRGETRKTSPLQNRARAYDDFIRGCAERYHLNICRKHDEERMRMNQHQPAIQTNFTRVGYTKVNIEQTKTYHLIKAFWNRHLIPSGLEGHGKPHPSRNRRRREDWTEGNIYVNHWNKPTEVLHIDHEFDGLTLLERQIVLQETREFAQRWISSENSHNHQPVPLIATSLYGIRVYYQGNMLSPHVDRLPLVISAIINVAQSSEKQQQEQHNEDWPLELIGHDGIAVNVTMKPGEMILYEGHSVIHGRPFPLNSTYYANLFVHFEPVGYTEDLEQRLRMIQDEQQQPEQDDVQQQQQEQKQQHDGSSSSSSTIRRKKSAKELFDSALVKQQKLAAGPPSAVAAIAAIKSKTTKTIASSDAAAADDDIDSPFRQKLPSYIEEGTLEAERWLQQYIFFRDEEPAAGTTSTKPKNKVFGGPKKPPPLLKHVTSAHIVAANGDLEQFKRVEEQDPKAVFKADDNGWKPLHEAARSGKTDIVEYILKKGKADKELGVDVNERTNDGKGANPLWWAKQQLRDNHPTIRLLEQHGAVPIGPHGHGL